jgi:dihydrofolate reductase
MARLIYATIASLDGYVADPAGNFEWAAPDEEVHAAVNDLQRPVGTYLYGRRMYETMAYWDTPEPLAEDQPPVMGDFARMWRAADKVVYSTTLEAPTTARTRLEPAFDPEAVRALIRAADRDVTIGGPTLAARAWRAGLVDECHVFTVPTLVGGGTSTYPAGVSATLVLVDEHRFTGGVVHLHYRVDRSA